MGGFHKDYPRQAADNRELQSCSDTATSGDELYGLTRTPFLHRGATLEPPARRRHPGLHVNVKRARQLDPNKGRCMITGRCTNVVSCHMLPLDTDDKTLTQLEWAWGLGWRRLDVTSPYNTLFVGAEWKALFDSRDWCLIPDLSVLHALDLLTEDRTANRPFRLNKVLRSRSLFKYYFVANSSLEDAIITVESAHRTRTVHPYPFARLGPIFSHVRPHFVVHRMCEDLKNIHGDSDAPLRKVLGLQESLLSDRAQLPPGVVPHVAVIRAQRLVASAGSVWMHRPVHEAFRRRIRASRRYLPAHGPLSLVSCSSTGGFALPTELSHVSWSEKRQNVHLWLAHVIREVADTGWESATLNDEQVANYLAEAEPVFAPPAKDDWRNWRPRWDRQKVTSTDSRRFSSNDWAALEFRVYLPVS